MSRVLVIEDDLSVVALLEHVLAQDGHTVTVVNDGFAGLLALQDVGAHDVVLLDIMMPDVDGHRVLDQLREEHADDLPVPVIVVTGSPRGAARARDQLGADRVVEKPFDPHDLLALIRDATGGAR